MTAADVALLRPPAALWGYDMRATDEALNMVARTVTERDVEIATLRRQLADLQSASPGGPGRAGPNRAGPPGYGSSRRPPDSPVPAVRPAASPFQPSDGPPRPAGWTSPVDGRLGSGRARGAPSGAAASIPRSARGAARPGRARMSVAAPGAEPGPDGLLRCPWGLSSPEYLAYHDEEWGRPVRDDTGMFERLCLEAFQSGLSWLTILRKREGFRSAFAGFDIEAVARYGPDDVTRLLGDAGIVRNRAKIEAAIGNARAALTVPGGLAALVWSYAGGPGPRPGDAGGRPVLDAPVEGAVQGTQAARVHLHGPGDRVRHPPGLRRGRRSPGVVLSPRRLPLVAGRVASPPRSRPGQSGGNPCGRAYSPVLCTKRNMPDWALGATEAR